MELNPKQRPKVLCIVGPTASGKSNIACRVAAHFGGEIINFDSRQIYKDFPLITDQPRREYTEKIPHWLYGFLDFYEQMDAASFEREAGAIIADISSRSRLPILVGGTGLYLYSILYGLDPIPEVPLAKRQEVLQEWNQEGPEFMYKRLQEIDPEYAFKIHPNDKQRITRALEVYKASGKPFSKWHQKAGEENAKYDALKIGIWMDVPSLTSSLEQRIEYMLQNGAVEEVGKAWEKYPSEDAPGWSGIGCYEVLQYVLGRWTVEEAKKKWLRRTKKYAKRQLTWFKKEPDIQWISWSDKGSAEELITRWSGTS